MTLRTSWFYWASTGETGEGDWLKSMEYFCIWCKLVIKFHFFRCSCPGPPTPFVEEAFFYSILCFCPLCQISVDHRDLGLFLGSLFCSIGPVPGCFDYSGLVIIQFISGIVIPPTLFFFLKIAAAIWHYLWFHINFWNVCSLSVKYVIGTLIGIALNL